MVFANLLRLAMGLMAAAGGLVSKDEYAADERQIARLLRYKP
jgi:hypothetical protein